MGWERILSQSLAQVSTAVWLRLHPALTPPLPEGHRAAVSMAFPHIPLSTHSWLVFPGNEESHSSRVGQGRPLVSPAAVWGDMLSLHPYALFCS